MMVFLMKFQEQPIIQGFNGVQSVVLQVKQESCTGYPVPVIIFITTVAYKGIENALEIRTEQVIRSLTEA